MKLVREASERALKRIHSLKIFIRGPHMGYKQKFFTHARGGDIVAHIFNDIIKTEFKGLQDKVFYLQPWDMTVAVKNGGFHPQDFVNEALTGLFLEKMCFT